MKKVESKEVSKITDEQLEVITKHQKDLNKSLTNIPDIFWTTLFSLVYKIPLNLQYCFTLFSLCPLIILLSHYPVQLLKNITVTWCQPGLSRGCVDVV